MDEKVHKKPATILNIASRLMKNASLRFFRFQPFQKKVVLIKKSFKKWFRKK